MRYDLDYSEAGSFILEPTLYYLGKKWDSSRAVDEGVVRGLNVDVYTCPSGIWLYHGTYMGNEYEQWIVKDITKNSSNVSEHDFNIWELNKVRERHLEEYGDTYLKPVEAEVRAEE